MASTAEIRGLLLALVDTPKQIVALTHGCRNAELHTKPTAGAWSAHEILTHLRACADVWGASIQRMITEDSPTIRYVSPRSWTKKVDYPEASFQDSLDAFSRQRGQLVRLLSTLDISDWSRMARFTGTVSGRE